MQDNQSTSAMAKVDQARAKPEYDDGSQGGQQDPNAHRFMSLQVTSAGQDDSPEKAFRRPISSQNTQYPQGHPPLSPNKNGGTSSSPFKLQRIKVMNQTSNAGQFKLAVPQIMPQPHTQSLSGDVNNAQLYASQTQTGNLFLQHGHQKPPTHNYNSAIHGGATQNQTNVPTRMRSPNLESQANSKLQGITNFTAPGTSGPNKSLAGKIKIQSNSLNRILQNNNQQQQKNEEANAMLQSSRNHGTGNLVSGASGSVASASGSQLGRPILRAQTNNLISAGATIMANSPHNPPEEQFQMPSLPGSGNNSQKRLLYRSKGRGESCERTINNTLDSILELNHKGTLQLNGPNVAKSNDANSFQNFQAMQMAIHNSHNRIASNHGSRTRIATIVDGLMGSNPRKDSMQQPRTSLPVIGKVNATQDSRTGILMKTQNLHGAGRRDGSGSTRVSFEKVNPSTGTTMQTKRSGSRDSKIISRVSSRFTDVSKVVDDEKYSESFSSDEGDPATMNQTRESKQLSVLEQMLKTEDRFPQIKVPDGSAKSQTEDAQLSAAPGPSFVNQLIQKEKDGIAAGQAEQAAPKIVGAGGKVPALAQDINVPKPKKNQPFDFNFIKIIIKRSSNDKEKKEVFLDRNWVQKRNNVPHFANVIKNVDKNEGVEITMNCNKAAFNWLMDFVAVRSNSLDHIERAVEENGHITEAQREMIFDDMDMQLHEKMDQIDVDSCLNILVTAYFLQLFWAYEKVWDYYFKRNFSEVVNSCQISLSNINPSIVRHIAERVGDDAMEDLKERKDKFISNVYKEKINYHIHMEGGVQPSNQAGGGDQTNAENEEFEKQKLKESKQLYWCKRCKQLLTKEQAMVISCTEPPALDDNGQPNCALGTKIFEFYKSRVNPLSFSPSSILQNMLMNEKKEEQMKDKKPGGPDAELSENDDGFINENGTNYFHHDIIFDEDVPQLVNFMNKLQPEHRKQIKVSASIDLAAFIKFFREKYRLCWKEIYLKIHALVYRPEQCKNCRKFFQIANIASCALGPSPENNVKAEKDDEEEENNNNKNVNLNQQFADVYFHEIDHPEQEILTRNDFSKRDISIHQQEVQVIDNQKPCFFMTQSDLDKGKKGKNQIEMLVERMKDQIEFIEPQSMNFDVKISDAYLDFLAKEEKNGKNINKIKASQDQSIVYDNGDKYAYVEDQIDDCLYRASKAQKKINKKLKDQKYMSKLQKECENYVRENPDEFKKADKFRLKFDFVDNQGFDNDHNKKSKQRKDQLDEVQEAEVQNLVIKRFRRTRKDLIYEDDEQAIKVLLKELTALRDQQTNNKSQRNMSGGGARPGSQNPRGSTNSLSQANKQSGQLLARNKSPQGHSGKADNNMASSDFATQSGIKIYSDIKQITAVKKASNKKAPIVVKGADAGRRNIMQRNVARSTGGRSGSNHNKNNNQNPIQANDQSLVPVFNDNNYGHRNSSNPSKRKQNNSMVLIDDQKDAGGVSQTPINNPENNLKTRSIMQTSSATRVQANQTLFSLEGLKNLQLPANNYINQSQEQLQTCLDGQYQMKERSLNQRRPLRSPGDSKNQIGTNFNSIENQNAGQIYSGRMSQQPFQGLTGTSYTKGTGQAVGSMKLSVPQAMNRSLVENNSSENVSMGATNARKHVATRSGSHGGSSKMNEQNNQSPFTSLHVPTQNNQPANASNNSSQQMLRIHKSPALKIRASKIEKAQSLIKISQQKQAQQNQQ